MIATSRCKLETQSKGVTHHILRHQVWVFIDYRGILFYIPLYAMWCQLFVWPLHMWWLHVQGSGQQPTDRNRTVAESKAAAPWRFVVGEFSQYWCCAIQITLRQERVLMLRHTNYPQTGKSRTQTQLNSINCLMFAMQYTKKRWWGRPVVMAMLPPPPTTTSMTMPLYSVVLAEEKKAYNKPFACTKGSGVSYG